MQEFLFNSALSNPLQFFTDYWIGGIAAKRLPEALVALFQLRRVIFPIPQVVYLFTLGRSSDLETASKNEDESFTSDAGFISVLPLIDSATRTHRANRTCPSSR